MSTRENWWQFQGFLKTPSLFLEEEKHGPFSFFSTDLFSSEKSDFSFIPDNLMLGKRAERFLNFYLITSKRYRIVLENFQLIENKKTLGEIDFIVQDKHTAEHLHIELSYKFYLLDPEHKTKALGSWIGPNRKDTLEQKLNKLKDKQFPLLKHPLLEKTLKNKGVPTSETKAMACFKAQLFVPHAKAFSLSPAINPKAIRGYYYTLPEFIAKQPSAAGYFIPEKRDWMRAPETQKEWHALETILPIIRNLLSLHKSPLIWSKQSAKTDVFFIVWW